MSSTKIERREKWERILFGLFIAVSACALGVALYFLGYMASARAAADEVCRALGAIAVETTDGYGCVMEVSP